MSRFTRYSFAPSYVPDDVAVQTATLPYTVETIAKFLGLKTKSLKVCAVLYTR